MVPGALAGAGAETAVSGAAAGVGPGALAGADARTGTEVAADGSSAAAGLDRVACGGDAVWPAFFTSTIVSSGSRAAAPVQRAREYIVRLDERQHRLLDPQRQPSASLGARHSDLRVRM
jgi:hypothetical protein